VTMRPLCESVPVTDSEFVSASVSERSSSTPENKSGLRRPRWILAAASGAALLGLAAAAAQHFSSSADDPAPTLAAVQKLDMKAIQSLDAKSTSAESTQAELTMPAPIPVKIQVVRVGPTGLPDGATAGAAEAADDPSLAQSDPRWARDVTEPNPSRLPHVETKPAPVTVEASRSAVTPAPARAAMAGEDDASISDRAEGGDVVPVEEEPLDPVMTASLPPSGAEMLADVEEAGMALPEESDLVPTPREMAAVDPAPKSAEEPTKAALRTSRVTDHVNMRSAPRGGSSVLTVIPADAVVEVIGCDSWCEISYEGRTGFVFNEFVNPAGSKAAAKPKQAKKVAAKKSAPAKAAPRTAAVKKPEPAATRTVAPSAPPAQTVETFAAPAQAGQRVGILKCGIFRQCATYDPSTSAAPPAAQPIPGR
jgi:uncharacterized protein YraI